MSLDTVYCLRHCFINPTEAILPSVKYNVKGQALGQEQVFLSTQGLGDSVLDR